VNDDCDVSQDTFPDSQNKKAQYHGNLDARVASFLANIFADDSNSVSHSQSWSQRRFQHKQENVCGKNNAASQAALASDTKIGSCPLRILVAKSKLNLSWPASSPV